MYKNILSLFMALLLCPTLSTLGATQKAHTPLPTPQPAKSTQPIALDRMIAVVNNQIITANQLEQAVRNWRRQLRLSHTAIPSPSQLSQQALQTLITQALQLQIAEHMNITVGKQELNQALNSMAARNRTTLSGMQATLSAQGINWATFREQIRKQILINHVQQAAVGQKIKVSAQEVRSMQQRIAGQKPRSYHLSDLLITIPDNPTATQLQAAKKTAETLKTQATKSNFAELAAAHSGGNEAVKGGDLGWKTTAELPDVFATALQNASKGDIIGPIKAPNGFHLLKIIGTRSSAKLPSAADVTRMIEQQKFSENVAVWLQQLRSTAYIKFEAAHPTPKEKN